jgi:hypothetical protein
MALGHLARGSPPLVLGLMVFMGWWFLWPAQTTCAAGISERACAGVAAAARDSQWANHRTTVAVEWAPDGWLIPDPSRVVAGEEAPLAALLDRNGRLACWAEIDSYSCQKLGDRVEQDS